MADSNASIPSVLPRRGSYRLTIRLGRPVLLKAGRLRRVRLPAGTYEYCGSARRNLPARVGRHLRQANKKLHWHIDYLLNCPAARVMKTRAWTNLEECDLVADALGRGGRAAIRGFGSSDCRRGCPAHLIYMGDKSGRASGNGGGTAT